MELNLKGDYYEWYCDWCDTRHVTLIHRITDDTFYCCACHKLMLYDAMNRVGNGHELRSRENDLVHKSAAVMSGGLASQH